MYYGSVLLLFTNILTGHCTLGHWTKQRFRPVPLTIFEILGFKLIKNNNNDNNDKKNWRNRLFAISAMFVVQFSPNFRNTYIFTSVIILPCQKWIITESESVNLNFQMYRHNGPRPRPFLYLLENEKFFVGAEVSAYTQYKFAVYM